MAQRFTRETIFNPLFYMYFNFLLTISHIAQGKLIRAFGAGSLGQNRQAKPSGRT